MKRFETGVAVPKEKHINTICEKYHVNPAYFTGEIGIDEAITEMPEDDRKNAGKRFDSNLAIFRISCHSIFEDRSIKKQPKWLFYRI